MKKAMLLIAILCSFSSQIISAQNITAVKHYLTQNEYDNVILMIEPVAVDATKSETTKLTNVYAVLICYTLRGKAFQKYQDVTYDFIKSGLYDYTFSFASVAPGDVVVNEVVFFRRDKNKNTYPPKTNCNTGGYSTLNSFSTSSCYN